MQIHYKVSVLNPQNHLVQVQMEIIPEGPELEQCEVFLPSWSPGSYLMREYGRMLQGLQAFGPAGERLYLEQTRKGTWRIDLKKWPASKPRTHFTLKYAVYCHELSVRTSWIDETHAFLHGPTYLMGMSGLAHDQSPQGTISFAFIPLWSKIATALDPAKRPVSGWEFSYDYSSYDQLLDCPVEIGCHESDGFLVQKRPHHLNFYGVEYPHNNNLKSDIQKIVETITDFMGGDLPYEHYHFITHFLPNMYGGLEHANSTVLHFDGRKLADRQEYIKWLGLVSHEYFHLWNVKRIRPKELGPFDYQNENYTRMLWLAEGLTAFMDNYFLLLSGLITETEYLELIKQSCNHYHKVEGRKFDSLEDSSFNAWIKLYRPHEALSNMTISYYLKGEFLFLWLASELLSRGSHIHALVQGLWQLYQQNPTVGLSKEQVTGLVEKLADQTLKEKFVYFIESTEDFPFEQIWKNLGLESQLETLTPKLQWHFGFDLDARVDGIYVRSVQLDGAAYQGGLNAGDEIIAFEHGRIKREDASLLKENLQENTTYHFLVARQGQLLKVDLVPKRQRPIIKEIKVQSSQQWKHFIGS